MKHPKNSKKKSSLLQAIAAIPPKLTPVRLPELEEAGYRIFAKSISIKEQLEFQTCAAKANDGASSKDLLAMQDGMTELMIANVVTEDGKRVWGKEDLELFLALPSHVVESIQSQCMAAWGMGSGKYSQETE